jgi:hypothetical protein
MWCHGHIVALCGVVIVVAIMPCGATATVIIMVALSLQLVVAPMIFTTHLLETSKPPF